MKKFLIGLLIIIALIYVFFVVLKPAAIAPSSEEMSPSPTSVQSSVSVVPTAPIIITSPQALELVKSPLMVTGRAIAFENTIAWRLRDQSGTQLASGTVMTNAPDVGKYGDYFISIPLPKNVPQTIIIDVFERSAKDGSEINKVSVPVVTK
jgi:hypothetical protein